MNDHTYNLAQHFIRILLLSLTLFLLFGFTSPLYAQSTDPRLDVTFNPDPLFSETDVKPGDDFSSRTATVENYTDESQNVLLETINEIDSTNFASEIDIIIKEGSNEVYSGTLANIFSSGEIFLSVLGPNSTTTYEFYSNVDSEAGNEYQEATVSFDVIIGFGTTTDDGGGDDDDGGGGSGGGSTGGSGSNNDEDEEEGNGDEVLPDVTVIPGFDLLPEILPFGLGGTETGQNPTRESIEEDDETTDDEEDETDEEDENGLFGGGLGQLAGLFSLPDDIMDLLWCLVEALLIVLLAFIIWSGLDYYYIKKLNLTKKEKRIAETVFYGAWAAIAILIIYLMGIPCVTIPLFVFLIGVILLFLASLWSRGEGTTDHNSSNNF